MALRTPEQYVEGLARMRPNLYINGEVVGRLDPRLQSTMNVQKETFVRAADPEWTELCTAKSHLTGDVVNRFCHIHQSKDDLRIKQRMTRVLCQRVGGCIQRCMGVDALNALSVVTKEVDLIEGTVYHERFLRYLEFFQANDLVGCCAQTDVKGDRSKRPHQQDDPDLYLHIIEERPDGIVVRGAKAHNTTAALADEIIVLPTRLMTEADRDYAVAFAIPADHPGVRQIVRTVIPRRREMFPAPLHQYGDAESLTIFEDVFVPHERVFLKGEHKYAGFLALLFAHFHRHSYTGCKPALSEIWASAAALVAEYSGTEKVPHIREKISRLIGVAELVFAAGVASAESSERFASGTQVPDEIFTNVGRRLAGESIYAENQVLADIAGGLCATLPFEGDLRSEENRELILKYLQRVPGVPTENILRCYQMLEAMLVGDLPGVKQVGGLHGGGSPEMETMALMARYPLSELKGIAKYLAGIEPDFKWFERPIVTPKKMITAR